MTLKCHKKVHEIGPLGGNSLPPVDNGLYNLEPINHYETLAHDA